MKKQIELLGKQVKPLLLRNTVSVTFASSKLYGADNMHDSCHMDQNRKNRMVSIAEKEILQENREQNWYVESIHMDGTYTLCSDYGYEKGRVKRNEFRLIKN